MILVVVGVGDHNAPLRGEQMNTLLPDSLYRQCTPNGVRGQLFFCRVFVDLQFLGEGYFIFIDNDNAPKRDGRISC